MFESIGNVLNFDEFKVRMIQKRIDNGDFFLDVNTIPIPCKFCNKLRKVVPAKSLWQKELTLEYYMHEKCYCDIPVNVSYKPEIKKESIQEPKTIELNPEDIPF